MIEKEMTCNKAKQLIVYKVRAAGSAVMSDYGARYYK